MRSPVILWQSEEDLDDIQRSLIALGYDAAKDEKLYIFSGSAKENNVEVLRDELRLHPDVKLCIIETLDDCLKISDLKENTASREAFDKFDNAVLNEFHPTVAFLALHHMKKHETDKCGEMIMGATVIRAKTDNKIYIRCVSDDDSRRVIWARVRKGIPIPKTYTTWDEATETATLGLTVAQERKDNLENTESRIRAQIRNHFVMYPDSTADDCYSHVSAHRDTAKRLLKQAVRDGQLVQSGKGTKGSPYRYCIAEIPYEEKAA